MEHIEKEWSELEEKAMYLLSHPHLLPEQKGLGKFHLALRLWHYPAFEKYTVWLVYRGVKDDTSCLLREVVWDMQDEAERMLNPLEGLKRGFHIEPTFRTRTIEIKREETDNRLAELQSLSLPAFIHSDRIGLDGESFGIAVGTGFLNAQVSWWCDGPEEWQQVITWFNQMKAYLVAELENE